MLACKLNIAGLCKGSTADSDSVCLGSNPSPAAKKEPCNFNDYRVLIIFKINTSAVLFAYAIRL